VSFVDQSSLIVANFVDMEVTHIEYLSHTN